MRSMAVVSLAVVLGVYSVAMASPYATTVVSYNAGSFDPGTGAPVLGYTDPTAVLGMPQTTSPDSSIWPLPPNPPQVAVTMTNPAWYTGQVLTIGAGGSLVVSFDHQVTNNPLKPYGIAFQIFTNAGFATTDYPTNQQIADGSVFGGALGQISVSQDGTTWYAVDATKLGTIFPTQAYQSAASDAATSGAALSNFTQPVDPALQYSDFSGLTVTQALALYNGSAGGLGINLNDLLDGNGDPASLAWIQYVQIDGATDGLTGFAETSVPEPATLGLATIGLAGLMARRRKGR